MICLLFHQSKNQPERFDSDCGVFMAHALRESIQNPLRASIDEPISKIIHLRINQICDYLVHVSIELQYKTSGYSLALVIQAQNFIQELS